jgi:hypothetical protein
VAASHESVAIVVESTVKLGFTFPILSVESEICEGRSQDVTDGFDTERVFLDLIYV